MPTPLAKALRGLRDRTQPEDVGYPAGGRRRVPGLRREEVAALANLSVDYLVQMEQGRADRPSAPVVAALCRALSVSRHDREHLYLAAGLHPPSQQFVSQHIPAGVQRITRQLHGCPVAVYDAAWTLLARNPLWVALHGSSVSELGENLVASVFLHDGLHHVPDLGHRERFKDALVSDVLISYGRYPHDVRFRRFVEEMRRDSEDFARRWASTVPQTFGAEKKTVHHPVLGDVTLDCDVLTDSEEDLRIVVYTAAASDQAAQQLAFLDVGSTR
ncbi:helix-turn-helix transcriptional regulator [Mumia zhuanghuii]|uniref:Helix-turn-helix domain-containing protein n=1 Tax=Mumia zhuanghuii TaxID=2585211 RepID=A0A5C4N189_9ACTN|nr:helix-turn-helix transcriptional regulator [Mumia zhuanghuii]TNC44624.1 helix-turn-helix domain-containing protein [Mumia zhuanghuii]TNC51060.1 helix-turn-helix domain-containing protein [Mumia zhuanghuii]